MGIARKYKAPFVENELFHVYNRTNNKELLFNNDENYLYFLNRFDHYASPFLELICWNLLPTHFHFCVKIKSFTNIIHYLNAKESKGLCKTEQRFLQGIATIHNMVDNAFQRFFISYTMYFNQLYNRKGNLLHRPFKHVHVTKDSQFTQLVIYINANAIKHKLAKDISEYKWSSYNSILSDKPTKLLREGLLEWFGGKAAFIKLHKDQTEYYYCDNFIEDD